MARVSKPKQRPKKSKVPRPRGIVDRHGSLEDCELINYENPKYILGEIEREMKMGKYKFEPGIQTLVNSPDPVASDCPWDNLSDGFWEAIGRQPAPVGYSGTVPPRSENEKKSWLACMRDAGMPMNSENKFLLGEL